MDDELLAFLRTEVVPWICEVVDSYPMDYYPTPDEHSADIARTNRLAVLLGLDMRAEPEPDGRSEL